MYAAVVVLGGALAAVAIPKGFFDAFGKAHVALALAVMFTVSWAAPIAVVVGACVFFGLRLLGTGTPLSAASLGTGMAANFAFGVFASATSVDESNLWHGLAVVLTVPWFAIPNLVAPWLGFAVGIWLCRRAGRSAHPAAA